MKAIAWIAALLLLSAALLYLYVGDRRGKTLERGNSPSPALSPDPAKTFPPAVTDARPPIVPDGTPVELCGYGQIVTTPGVYPYPASVQASARQLLQRVADDMARPAIRQAAPWPCTTGPSVDGRRTPPLS